MEIIEEEKETLVLLDPVSVFHGQAYLIDLYENQLGYKVKDFRLEKYKYNDELLILKCTVIKSKEKTRKK